MLAYDTIQGGMFRNLLLLASVPLGLLFHESLYELNRLMDGIFDYLAGLVWHVLHASIGYRMKNPSLLLHHSFQLVHKNT